MIGGGIYGACIAWEAVLRGLSVALLEREDFGGQTSSNSQKIIHGGFRYLQHADFKRMREHIRERTTFMKIAPHLVHPMPVVIPTYGHGMRGKEIFALALAIYDLVSFDRNRLEDSFKHIPRGKILSKGELFDSVPNLPQDGVTGGAVFYDAQVYNSERFLLAFLKSAEKLGCDMANYMNVTDFITGKGRIAGVMAKDAFTGDEIPVQAKMTVNAGGPWIYQILGLLDQYRSHKKFPLVKSVNVVTPLLFPSYAVGIYGKMRYSDKDAFLDKGTRLFFVTPWRGLSVVGTALSYYEGNPDELEVTREDVQNFLDDFNQASPLAQVQIRDVRLIQKGFLPSSGLDAGGNVQISKKYRILDHSKEGLSGLMSVMGVKYTTARDVAEKTVDLIFKIWGKTSPPSKSSTTVLHGGKIERLQEFLSQAIEKRPRGFTEERIKHLVENYGSGFEEVLQLVERNETRTEGLSFKDVLRAEILYGIREEMAMKLSDVVMRRTELGSAGNPGEEMLAFCASVMGKEMGWNVQRTQAELEEVRKIYVFF